MRLAALAAALLLGACANDPLARCEKREFVENDSEDVQKELQTRADAARERGRQKWIELKRLDPDYPSEPERLGAERRRLNGELCWRYGYYDEALLEFEKAAAATPESRGSISGISAGR